MVYKGNRPEKYSLVVSSNGHMVNSILKGHTSNYTFWSASNKERNPFVVFESIEDTMKVLAGLQFTTQHSKYVKVYVIDENGKTSYKEQVWKYYGITLHI